MVPFPSGWVGDWDGKAIERFSTCSFKKVEVSLFTFLLKRCFNASDMKAVILAGGSGTRLWPLSRANKPKQFQKLLGNASMLQETLSRLDFLSPQDLYVATNHEYFDVVKEQTKGRVPLDHIIIEPALRDTAPCIGLAATYIAHKHPEEVMSIIYADHSIQNKSELAATLKAAEKIARQEKTLNIIEVKAKFPNVNLGYVKVGKPLATVNKRTVYSFEGFTEKPSLEVAREFLQSFKYLWNTGLYVWRVDVILRYYKKFLPQTYANLMAIKAALGTEHQEKMIKKHYPLCDKISIDYGIMEKVNPRDVRIIPAELGWSDVGTWESIMDELPSDGDGNIVKGNHVSLHTKSSLVYSNSKKLIATIGVENLVIVDTEDALLICKKDQSQEVKKLVEKIKKLPKYKDLL